MKHRFCGLLTICLAVFVFSNINFAQNSKNDKTATAASSLYVISAKAGAVNFVEGKVSVAGKNAKSGNLQKGDELQVGEKVTTDTDGKAEILLNPGSFIRVAGDSEFEFTTTSLDDLQLSLTKGSAIFEVIADKQFKVTVNTGKSRFYLIQSGIYRIDALPDNTGKISVWKGKAQVGDINATTIKGGKTGAFTDGQVVVAKFDRDNKSDFEVWSKARAKEIAKINEKLIQREMSKSLLNSFSRNGFSNYGGYGLWVFDATYRGYCFLPFSYGASSPYGYTYNQSIWSYSAPATVFYNNNQNATNTNGQYSNGNVNQTPTYQMPPMGNNGGGNSSASQSMPSSGNNSSMESPSARPSMNERHQENTPPPPPENRRID